jgi:hypothetical protein
MYLHLGDKTRKTRNCAEQLPCSDFSEPGESEGEREEERDVERVGGLEGGRERKKEGESASACRKYIILRTMSVSLASHYTLYTLLVCSATKTRSCIFSHSICQYIKLHPSIVSRILFWSCFNLFPSCWCIHPASLVVIYTRPLYSVLIECFSKVEIQCAQRISSGYVIIS